MELLCNLFTIDCLCVALFNSKFGKLNIKEVDALETLELKACFNLLK